MKLRLFGAGLALALSLAAHMLVMLIVAIAAAMGAGGRYGEDGHLGGGGDEVEFEIAAVSLGQRAEPNPSIPEPRKEEPAPESSTPEEAAPTPTPDVLAQPATDTPAIAVNEAQPQEPREDETSEPSPADRPPPQESAPPSPAENTEDTTDLSAWVLRQDGDGEENESGRLEGNPDGEADDAISAAAGRGDTGEAASVLAPDGSLCDDPVAGTWVAAKYKATVAGGRWVRFTLFVERDGATLSGRILSRIWDGGPSDRRPPRDVDGECRAFDSDMTWMMAARGSYRGNAMNFSAERARLIRQDCPGNGAYAPDRFRGTVEPEEDRFRARNNDGAYDIDEPYAFRRVACD